MKITSLKLTNIRSIEKAEFRFHPGFNLIVGVNGVGKSTVLDALRICLSRVLPRITDSRSRKMSFDVDDIRSGFSFLDAELLMIIDAEEFCFTRRQWREPFNDEDAFTPSIVRLMIAARAVEVAPNCVFFATNRSFVSYGIRTKARAAGAAHFAYASALVPRPMNIAEFADWMRAQQALAKEQNAAKRHLQVLRTAVNRFLPTYKNLRPADDNDKKTSHLMIDQGKIELEVGQLSDGERGVLALVLDLARRLSQANPSLDDPLSEGHAVVLIDEIDLHLHPKWQRQIVHNLTKTFPLCQFIATTHSPQVIGEVEHDQIHIMADGEVYSPTHSFGVDSSRVLEEIMDAEPRAMEVEQLLKAVSQEVRKQRYDNARELLDQLVERVGESDPEVSRISTLLDFMEGEE